MKFVAMLLLAASVSVAADLSGTWAFHVVVGSKVGAPTFQFEQTGAKLAGTCRSLFGLAKLKGAVKGNSIEFAIVDDEHAIQYNAIVTARDKMSGTLVLDGAKGTFTAKRLQ
jgi:hypothetical protein